MPGPKLAVLYAAPLVWLDKKGQNHPVQPLDFATERALLFDSLTQAQRQIEVRIEAANTDNLLTLLTLGYDAIHYSGHGHARFLAFEDGKGKVQQVTPALIRGLFSAAGRHVKFVFVSACHSRKAGDAFVQAGVPHVVAIRLNTPVYDAAARAFARAFYLALACGKTIREAFLHGRQAVGLSPELKQAAREKEKFLLLPDDGNPNHEIQVFGNAGLGIPVDATPRPGPARLRQIPEHFIGREVPTQEIVEAVLSRRLVTVRGAPGIGKSAVAVAAGHYLNERRLFADGVFFVPLKGAKSSEAIRSAIAGALSIAATDDGELFAALSPRRCLLILDNFEDVLHAAPGASRAFLNRLLQEAGSVALLLTSRELIGNLDAATELPYRLLSLDVLDAARLFIAVAPRSLTAADLGTTDGKKALTALVSSPVMKFLSGHPQAIRLAAPLLVDKSLAELHALLKSQSVDALVLVGVPEEERDATTSLVISIGASVQHLTGQDPDALRLLALMGLLPGGAFAPELAALFGDKWESCMDALLRASLVERDEIGPMKHFHMFPFVTDYAARYVVTAQDRRVFLPPLLTHFAQAAKLLYLSFGGNNAPLARLLFAFQEDNLWACLSAELRTRQFRSAIGATLQGRVATYLARILLLSDRTADGIRAAEMGRQACIENQDRLGEANTLQALGDLKLREDDLGGARADYDSALGIFRQTGDRLGEANTLQALGDLKLREQDLDGARADYQSALGICREIGERLGEANTLQALGDLKLREDDLGGARADYDSALGIFRQSGARLGEANTLQVLGDLKRREQDLDGARADYQSALGIYREIGERLGEANTLQALGDLKRREQDLGGARADYDSALGIFRQIGDRLGEANTLKALGDLKLREDDLGGARADYGSALGIFRQIGERTGEANCLQGLGNVESADNMPDRAMEEFQLALDLHFHIGDRLGVAADLGYMAQAAVSAKRYAQAVWFSEEALSIHRVIDDRLGQALDLESQAQAFGELGQEEAALAAYWTALNVRQAMAGQEPLTEENLKSTLDGPVEHLRELLSAIGQNPEALRSRAVGSVCATLSADPLIARIRASLSTLRGAAAR